MLISRVFPPALRAAVAAVFLITLVGCDEDVSLNPAFSLNLIQPGPKWPNVKKLTPAQKEVFEKYGKPDRLRVQWTPEGRIMQRDELRQQFKDKQPKELPPCFWVYQQRGIEIAFDQGTPREQPISDQVKLVLQHGDPEDVKQLPGGLTQWTFYSTGRLFKFSHGKIVEERDFPAMGRYIK